MFVAVILSLCLLLGVNGQRIAGGASTTIQDYPFAVALLTNNGEGSYNLGCGGTILTANAILSAASCFYNNTEAHPVSWWRARVGSSLSNSGGIIYLIRRITPHPEFSPTTLVHDLAVLRTSVTMELVPGSVQPARLTGAAYEIGINQRVVAIGWGATSNQDASPSSQLHQVQIWTITQTVCTNRWNELGVAVSDTMLCTGWLDVGIRGQCAGDAGSPLLHETEGFVIGVFSRAEGCALARYPDINTRVAPYTRWIISAAYE